MSKNYLDIAANGNLVKKSIEEICYAISQNPERNSGKYFKLKYDTENEHTNELDRVSIVLEAVEPEIPKINGELGQILINDGNDWISPSEIFFSSNESETRIGPNLIDASKKSFVLSGNPLFKSKEDESLRDNEIFKFSLNDFADVSFGGENLSVLDGRSQLILHDDSKLNLTRNAQLYAHGPVQINIDDGSYLDNNGNRKYNYNGNNSIEYLDAATIRLHDKSLLSMSQGASIIAQGTSKVFFEGSPKIYFRDESNLNIFGASLLTLQPSKNYSPSIILNGGSSILFNSLEETEYDPFLIADPCQFTFIGKGSSGSTSGQFYNNNPYPITYDKVNKIEIFDGIKSLIPTNNNPRFQISNETLIIIDAEEDKGCNYIRIGAEDKLLQIDMSGNIFQQMTGNAHSEIHDNSKFIMRGPSENPWVGENNGHCGESWITPIEPTNSPVLGLYDVSQFIMRGKWDYNEEDKPENWSPTINKIKGQPLLEIIEDAEVRITGNSALKMNDFSIEATSEGISFGNGEDSVIFSIEELKKLKTLLSNSEIEE